MWRTFVAKRILSKYIKQTQGQEVDRNSTFSLGRIFDHEVEIDIFHEIEFFCKIDQEIEQALGALGALGGHYFRLFSLT